MLYIIKQTNKESKVTYVCDRPYQALLYQAEKHILCSVWSSTQIYILWENMKLQNSIGHSADWLLWKGNMRVCSSRDNLYVLYSNPRVWLDWHSVAQYFHVRCFILFSWNLLHLSLRIHTRLTILSWFSLHGWCKCEWNIPWILHMYF